MPVSHDIIPLTPGGEHPEYWHFGLSFLKAIMFKTEKTSAQAALPWQWYGKLVARPQSGAMQAAPPVSLQHGVIGIQD